MKKRIIKINDLPITKQIELRAILERNKPKTRIKTKQQLTKISEKDYRKWLLKLIKLIR
jgi:hypothetical protein